MWAIVDFFSSYLPMILDAIERYFLVAPNAGHDGEDAILLVLDHIALRGCKGAVRVSAGRGSSEIFVANVLEHFPQLVVQGSLEWGQFPGFRREWDSPPLRRFLRLRH